MRVSIAATQTMDADYGIPRELSDLQKLRSQYQPELPPCLQVSLFLFLLLFISCEAFVHGAFDILYFSIYFCLLAVVSSLSQSVPVRGFSRYISLVKNRSNVVDHTYNAVFFHQSTLL